MKTFYILNNIGKAKYTVNTYAGKSHKDGSKFYDISIFSNKKKRDKYIKDLISKGYKQT